MTGDRTPHDDGREPRRPDASMTLLTSMLERPLDPSYQAAADRRTAVGQQAATSTRTVLVFVMMLLTGLLFAVGAQALRPKPTAAVAVRDELVSRIETLQSHGSQQEAAVSGLSRQVSDLEALALQQAGSDDLTTRISALEVGAAAVPMKGSGLTLTIDDAPAVDGAANAGARPDSGFEQGRVTSADLQVIVNGLWGAGAEAIAINGHRLSSTAAIRFAGQAIIVDFRPLARPYVITVLGDPRGIQSLFEPSFAGIYLGQLAQEFQIRSSITAADDLTVPGDTSARLDHAVPIPAPGTTSTSAPTGTPTGTPTARATATPTARPAARATGASASASTGTNPSRTSQETSP